MDIVYQTHRLFAIGRNGSTLSTVQFSHSCDKPRLEERIGKSVFPAELVDDPSGDKPVDRRTQGPCACRADALHERL